MAAGDNPFVVLMDQQLEAVIRLATSQSLMAEVSRLPDEPVDRRRQIDQVMAAEYVDGGSLIRVSTRWFEESGDRSQSERYVPSAGAGSVSGPNKTSVCVSAGFPTKGVGVCASVGR